MKIYPSCIKIFVDRLRSAWFRKVCQAFMCILLGYGGLITRSSAQVVVYEDFVPPMEAIYMKERFFLCADTYGGFYVGL